MDKILDGLAPYYLHVSYVVRDIEAARESFMRLMGVKHFGVMELPMAAPLLMRGKPVAKPFGSSWRWAAWGQRVTTKSN
jgi:hypothetical protein